MARVRNHQAGFTLIEIMTVVVIIAVLAVIAIPQFMSDNRKTKSNSEVVAFFSELGIRQEQYRVENSTYLSTTVCPLTTSLAGQVVDCTTIGKPWAVTAATNLNVKPPTTTAFCTYRMTSGTGSGTGPITVGTATFTFTSPGGPWFYIVGECDMNGDGTTAKFFTSSVDSSIQRSVNEDD